MKIAILGGTFNPPHFGHLFFANEVRTTLGLDKIIFIPTSISAHKIGSVSVSDIERLEMLKLAVDGVGWAEVSDCDMKRGGVTRTIDTIRDVKEIYHLDEKPGFIIGDDLFSGFSKWKDPEKIVVEANLIVGCRDGHKISSKYPFISIENRVFPLSSSEIRDRVQHGKKIDFLLPEKVIKYICEKRLYS